MGTPYASEIRIMSFGFAPKGWAQCDGQLLPINQNQLLFALLGTTYGGDGKSTFALPNLQGRTANHFDNSTYFQGQTGGEPAHTLNILEIPVHTHSAAAAAADGDSPIPTDNFLGAADNMYGPLGPAATSLTPATIGDSGGNEAHENMQPYLALNFCICINGAFPPPN